MRLQDIDASASPEVQMNENFEAVEPASLFGVKWPTTTGLTFGYYGGILYQDGTLLTISDGTVLLTASQAAVYIEATLAGVVSMNIVGFTAGRIPLYQAVTSASAITSIVNKRAFFYSPQFYRPRSVVLADAVSVTPDSDTTDVGTQANTQAAGTLTFNAPTGTPINGQKLIIRVKSTNQHTLSFNAAYRGSTQVALPTQNSGSAKTDYFGFIYNSADSKWDLAAMIKGF